MRDQQAAGEVLETFEHCASDSPVGAVIWLHGLGADAHDFEPVVPLLDPGAGRPLRFVFPNAPQRPVTLNAGMVMRAWYDIKTLERGGDEDEPGLRATAAAVSALIADQVRRGVPAERIVLAGFSQGGAMALFTGLRYPEKLAGLIALSCYLPMASTLAAEASAANRSVPIFMAHGLHDPVVHPSFGQLSCEALRAAGYSPDWRTYPMPHSVIPEQLEDIRGFLDSQFEGV